MGKARRGHPVAVILFVMAALLWVAWLGLPSSDILNWQYPSWMGRTAQVALPVASLLGLGAAVLLRDRGGSPVAALLVVLITVGLVGAVGFLVSVETTLSYDSSRPETWTSQGEAIAWVVGLSLVVLGGLWFAWRLSIDHEGGWFRRRLAGRTGPTWAVAEPGADLKQRLWRGQPWAYLSGGTVVTEVWRAGSRVLVATAEGLSGWVAADQLKPSAPRPDRDGGADER